MKHDFAHHASKRKSAAAVSDVQQNAQVTPVLVVQLTVPQLRELFMEWATELIDAQPAHAELVDDRKAAQSIDSHHSRMAELAREGAPHYQIGDRRRWCVPELKEYLRVRPNAEAAE